MRSIVPSFVVFDSSAAKALSGVFNIVARESAKYACFKRFLSTVKMLLAIKTEGYKNNFQLNCVSFCFLEHKPKQVF